MIDKLIAELATGNWSAAFALGQMGQEARSKKVKEALLAAASHHDPDVRSHAAYALGHLRFTDAEVGTILGKLSGDTDIWVRWAAEDALIEHRKAAKAHKLQFKLYKKDSH